MRRDECVLDTYVQRCNDTADFNYIKSNLINNNEYALPLLNEKMAGNKSITD